MEESSYTRQTEQQNTLNSIRQEGADKAKEAKQTEGEDATDDMRLAFELRFSRKLFDDYRPIDTHKMISYTFIDTTFDEIEKWVVIDKF